MKKIAVAKSKVTLKLEDTLPAFLCWFAYPRITIKRSYPHGNFFSIYPTSYSLKYIDCFSTYINDFFIISTLRHKISIYRHPSTLKTHNIPYPPSNLLPNSTIKKIINRIASIFNATYATLKTT